MQWLNLISYFGPSLQPFHLAQEYPNQVAAEWPFETFTLLFHIKCLIISSIIPLTSVVLLINLMQQADSVCNELRKSKIAVVRNKFLVQSQTPNASSGHLTDCNKSIHI